MKPRENKNEPTPATAAPEPRLKPGDWIRYNSGGTLSIAVVEYVQGSCALTTNGHIHESLILEVRRATPTP